MEETKKSVVSTVKFIESKDGQFGQQHIFEVSFENNDKGRFYAKDNPQNKFIEGRETEYTIEAKVNGSYTNYFIKPIKKPYAGAGAAPVNEKAMNARAALNTAALLVVGGKAPDDKETGQPMTVSKLADKMFVWLENKSK